MKAGMIVFQLKAGKLNEFIRQWNRMLVEVENIPGFRIAYLLSDATSNKCLAFGFWQTEEDAESFARSEEYARFMASVRDLLGAPPVRELYDLSGQADVTRKRGKAA